MKRINRQASRQAAVAGRPVRIDPHAHDASAPPAEEGAAAPRVRIDPRQSRRRPVRTQPQAATLPVPMEVARIPDPASCVLVVTCGTDPWPGAERELLGAAHALPGDGVALLRLATVPGAVDAGRTGADRVMLHEGTAVQTAQDACAVVMDAMAFCNARYVLFADALHEGDVLRRVASATDVRPATGVRRIDGTEVHALTDGGRREFRRVAPRLLALLPGVAPFYDGPEREAAPWHFTRHVLSDAMVVNAGPVAQDTRNLPLAEARFIVSAGEGVHDWSAFFRVADTLGATVGASRMVCDAGLLPRDRQVGASGTILQADCYVAFGISGAPQHLQGIQHCRLVVAVNTDPYAAIVRRADLAIIADAQAVMPVLAALGEDTRHDG
ncbi:electron transfer flavoprotein subunit alpha/FixB family protein [Komagataeibacter sp. FNDCF1]|uniref:electron transfer flavoprotein subunit alpha/FixB family protein n=1 Tax=Komagataeibacter sp. FNDCF1 TaxID=2878681 RepID=UPI001E335C95|nr:electron transfer flavoprotein subunit alpha/FixB family protein [Komagataeibacter sp. FNDCF1]MCE2565253.1 electron transfer flavoprotein subunit alpha/FixB family protein [Komagataeibacter sp. FNDCF1]